MAWAPAPAPKNRTGPTKEQHRPTVVAAADEVSADPDLRHARSPRDLAQLVADRVAVRPLVQLHDLGVDRSARATPRRRTKQVARPKGELTPEKKEREKTKQGVRDQAWWPTVLSQKQRTGGCCCACLDAYAGFTRSSSRFVFFGARADRRMV